MAQPIDELPEDERQRAEAAVRTKLPGFHFVASGGAAGGGQAEATTRTAPPVGGLDVGGVGMAGAESPDVSLGVDLQALKAAYRRVSRGAGASADLDRAADPASIVGAGLPDADAPPSAGRGGSDEAVQTRVGVVEPDHVPGHDPARMRKMIMLDGDNNVVGMQG